MNFYWLPYLALKEGELFILRWLENRVNGAYGCIRPSIWKSSNKQPLSVHKTTKAVGPGFAVSALVCSESHPSIPKPKTMPETGLAQESC